MNVGSRVLTPCFDAGSKYCPCALAELGQCVCCSLLRGDTICRCGWSGVCIYAEYLRNGKITKPSRCPVDREILGRTDIAGQKGTKAFILEVQATDELASWCVLPGSFVLLRPKGLPERWNVPICVLEAQNDALTLAVQIVGPKTIALDEACHKGALVTVIGPFWSGLQGQRQFRNLSSGKVVAVAKGINQASLVQAAQYIRHRGGSFKALIGPGNLGSFFSQPALEKAGAAVIRLPREKDHNLARMSAELIQNRYDLLISAGGDAQHTSLMSLLKSIPDPPKLSWSSNLTMTCAEGICGACLVSGFRGCKSELPKEITLGGAYL